MSILQVILHTFLDQAVRKKGGKNSQSLENLREPQGQQQGKKDWKKRCHVETLDTPWVVSPEGWGWTGVVSSTTLVYGKKLWIPSKFHAGHGHIFAKYWHAPSALPENWDYFDLDLLQTSVWIAAFASLGIPRHPQLATLAISPL